MTLHQGNMALGSFNATGFLTKIGGYGSAIGAEIPAFDPVSQRLFVVAGPAVEILNFSDPANPTKIANLSLNTSGDPDSATPGGFNLIPNSVTVGKVGTVSEGIVAVAIAITNQTSLNDNPGEVQFFRASDGAYLGKVTVGYLPDMLTFTPDGKKILTANEGQPNHAYTFDPVGSVSIIDLSNGVINATVQEASFESFNAQIDSLRASGVRIFGPNASVAQDLEPEYITFNGDGTKAWVTLQENNAIAVVDIATATVESILPLGLKNHNSVTVTGLETFEIKNLPSIGSTEASQELFLGGFSGLFYEGKAANGNLKFITHTDRGPNGEPTGINRPFLLPDFTPEIVRFELNRSTGQITLTERIQLKDSTGKLLSGLPNTSLSTNASQAYNDEVPVDLRGNILTRDSLGGDFEGIVVNPQDNSFWMVDEYRPAIYHFDSDGKLRDRFVPTGTAETVGQVIGTFGTEALPAVLAQRRQNRGFEAVSLNTDTNKLYAFVQSPLRNPTTLTNSNLNNLNNIRVVEFDLTTKTVTAQYLYRMDNGNLGGDLNTRPDKLGDAVYIGNGEFLIVERDDDSINSGDALNTIEKKVYRFSLVGATNINGLDAPINSKTLDQMTQDELIAAGVTPLRKTLHIDLTKAGYNGVEKVEGLALVDQDTIAVINDNDFQVAGITIDTTTGTFTPDPSPEPIVLGLITINSNGIDPSDQDGGIKIRNVPVFGMYQPDSITSFTANGQTYYVTANEGDSRGYSGFSEEIRVNNAGYVLDPTIFPDAATLKQNANLGRLQLTKATGDLDGDGDIDQIQALGSRSFSIWDSNGKLVYDSGDDFEQKIASVFPANFNADNEGNNFDNRSDNKGPEPEGVAVGTINGRTYAFIGLERVGGVMVYEVTNPTVPNFVQYINPRDFAVNPQTNATDSGPEGLTFIPASDSPNGQPLVVVANEISKTVTVYVVDAGTLKMVKGTINGDVLEAGKDFVGLENIVLGLGGNDEIDAGLGTGGNTLGGGNGDDLLFAGKNDLLLGDRGNDELDASDEGGNNSLYGGEGNDTLFAGNHDKIFGGAGDDTLFAGTGNNFLYGGTGRDRFWIANAELPTSVNTIADFDQLADQIALQVNGINTREDLSFEQTGKDVVIKVKATGESIATVKNTNIGDFNSNNFIFDSNSPLNSSQPIINPQAQNRKKVTKVESLGLTSFNTDTFLKDTQVGGLSGLVYDPSHNRYYAISDDRSNIDLARFYTLNINLNDGRLDNGDVSFTGVTTLLDSQGNPFPLNSLDPEGIALTENGSVYISSEGDTNALINPFVNEFSLSGQQISALSVNDKYFPTADKSKGIRNNLVFESLTLTPDRRYLYTATENALAQDGSAATLEDSSLSRIIKYDLSTGQVVGEFVYEVEPVADTPNPAGSFATNGLVELLALDNNGTLLALERSFSTGVGNTVKLYEVLTQGALNVKDLADLYREDPLEDEGEVIAPDRFAIDSPVQKRLLFDFADLGITPDNLEGMSLGPILPDGRQSLIVVSDNNFSATQTTQFIALGLTLDTLPAVLPTVETPYTIDDDAGTTPLIGDCDDPAVWIDPTDSGNSLIIGTLKDGGLAVFNLDGTLRQAIAPTQMLGTGAEYGDIRYNNVDVLYGFNLNGETVDIAVVSDRANDTVNIFKINPATRQLESITAPTLLNSAFSIFEVDDGEMTAYGLASYKSPVTGKYYVFVTQAGGNKIAQLELQAAESGTITASVVRTIELPIAAGDDPEDYQSEAIAVDQEKGIVYLAVEGKIGIVKFAAEPNGSNQVTVVRPVDSPELVPDLEGLAIYYGPNGTGYLIASSQGDSTYAVYSREENNTYLGSFVVGDNTALGIDQANETDGLEIINVPLGSAFPFGALLVQDGANDPQNVVENDDELENNATNFKFIPWESVAKAFQTPLLIDTTSYNPRTSNNYQPPIDGNFDGIPDSEQPNVTSVQTPNNQFVTFVSDPLRPPAQIQAIANPSPGNVPANLTFPLGFFEFSLPQVTPGGASTITLYLPQGTNINTYWKFGPTLDNPSNHWYNFDFDPITQTGAQFTDLNGDGRNEIILNFVDGQRGDRDLTVNGQIQDPGAPAFAPNSAPTAITLTNLLSLIDENTNGGIKVADLTIIDDGQGVNTLFLSGNDAASFEIRDNALFFIGSSPDFERQIQYQVIVNVDDPTVGNTPDATVNYLLQVTNLPDFDVSNAVSKFGDDNKDGLGSLAYDFSGISGNIMTRADDNALNQTNALFHNLIGLYPVLNANGAILDSLDVNGNGLTTDLLNPGDVGYARTAISSRVNNFNLQLGGNGNLDKNTSASEFGDVLLQGGQLYAPFAIANGGNLIPNGGSIQDGINVFFAQNPNNTAATLDNFINHAVAYFSFGIANPDGAEHLQNRGNNTFGFEDLPGNLGISDFDFNDAVFKFTFLG